MSKPSFLKNLKQLERVKHKIKKKEHRIHPILHDNIPSVISSSITAPPLLPCMDSPPSLQSTTPTVTDSSPTMDLDDDYIENDIVDDTGDDGEYSHVDPSTLALGYGRRRKSSAENFKTPKDLYDALDAEFHFVFDPCPLGGHLLFDGLKIPWKASNFVNPPWSDVQRWVVKAREEFLLGHKTVLLIPARVSSSYWHDYVLTMATEIRFIKGRVPFGKYIKKRQGVPIPICIVIFDPDQAPKHNVLKIGRFQTAVWTKREEPK